MYTNILNNVHISNNYYMNNPFMGFGCCYSNPFLQMSMMNSLFNFIQQPFYNVNYTIPQYYTPTNYLYNNNNIYNTLPQNNLYSNILQNLNFTNNLNQLYNNSFNTYNTNNNFLQSYELQTYSEKKPNYKEHYDSFNKNYLNKEFLNRVKQIAKNINCDYRDLLAVMNSESSMLTVPKNWNGKSAVGLIQFTNIALAEIKRVYGINLTKADVAKMTAMEQLDLVEKFYKCQIGKFNGRKLKASDLYAITFLPANSHKEILTQKGQKTYNENKGLDVNNDGYITKSDLEVRIAKKRVSLDTFA